MLFTLLTLTFWLCSCNRSEGGEAAALECGVPVVTSSFTRSAYAGVILISWVSVENELLSREGVLIKDPESLAPCEPVLRFEKEEGGSSLGGPAVWLA